jgi:translation initiation factor IF-2
MRARGASVTDLVILVVAADDGVMPQTKEAIAHAKAAKVPIIVAVNKIDKPNAEPERVRSASSSSSAWQPEEWGGDTIFVNVSALTGEGVDTLLEMVAAAGEVLELKANPKRSGQRHRLEAKLDKGRGPVARPSSSRTARCASATSSSRARLRQGPRDDERARQAAPGGGPLDAGRDPRPLGRAGRGRSMHAVKDAKKAQEIAESRRGKMAKSLIPATAKVSLEELSKRISESGQQELRVIIKGDVQGSVEAVADALTKLSTEKVRLSVIHAGVGAITEGDVNLAIASKAIIIGFNVRPAVEDVKKAMEGLLSPTFKEKYLGRSEVRELFSVPKVGTVAGCHVQDGKMLRNAQVRLLRDNVVIYEGKMSSLRRFKDDIKEVASGYECGIGLENYNDLKVGDIIEAFEMEKFAGKL